MNRPYVICHMTISLDGKVTGEHLARANHSPVSEVYYEINRNYKADAYACGRVTMEGSFTGGWYPDLSEFEPTYSPVDYPGDEVTGFYAVAFDPHGRLGWKSNRIIDVDEDPGYDKAHIIEILTDDIQDEYLAFLRERGISYLFCGENKIDVGQMNEKLCNLFGIKKLMLEGGGLTDTLFLDADCIDELSLVIAPLIDGSRDGIDLFKNKNCSLTEYRLERVQQLPENGLWLNYVKGEIK